MRVLALDACYEPVSAALGEPGTDAPAASGEGGAVEALAPTLQRLLAEAAADMSAVDLIAVTVGPGGFTGMRVGIATARALALARNIEILPLGALEPLAELARASAAGRPIAVVKDVRRDELVLQRFDPQARPAGPPRLVRREALAAACGPDDHLAGLEMGAAAPPGLHILTPDRPMAALVHRVASRRLAEGARPSPRAEVRPWYQRPPDARPGAGAPLVGGAAR